MPFNANCPGCGSSDPCGCSDPYSDKTGSGDVKYTGPNLPGTGIQTCDTLTVALQKIDNAIVQLQSSPTTSTTTTTTTEPPGEYNFDITAQWLVTSPAVTDENSFRTFLESGGDRDGNQSNLTDVIITNFSLIDGRLRCNLSATGVQLYLEGLEITEFRGIGNISGLIELSLRTNDLRSFNPVTPLPNSLEILNIRYNELTNFNPSLPLPNSLIELRLSYNLLTSFNPSVALPNSLQELQLNNNRITNFNPTISLPSSLRFLILSENLITSFNPSLALPSTLEALNLSYNQIVIFNPSIALPTSLLYLYLDNNRIATFNPSLPLPASLSELYLENNQIVTFNPDIPLPDSIQSLNLNDNQMTLIGYAASEPWANAMSIIAARGYIQFYNNVDTVVGTNLESILVSKGWTLYV